MNGSARNALSGGSIQGDGDNRPRSFPQAGVHL